MICIEHFDIREQILIFFFSLTGVAEKLNVRIRDEFEANGEDYDRQVSLAIASGELPDALFIGSKDILDELVEDDASRHGVRGSFLFRSHGGYRYGFSGLRTGKGNL